MWSCISYSTELGYSFLKPGLPRSCSLASGLYLYMNAVDASRKLYGGTQFIPGPICKFRGLGTEYTAHIESVVVGKWLRLGYSEM
jgi:hypothetical protein